MSWLVPMPIVLPLLAAGMSLALYRRPRIQRALGVVVLIASGAASIALLTEVRDGDFISVQAGGWPAPIGITLVVDAFAALMLVIANVMLLAVLVYAIASRSTTDRGLFFHPVYLVLTAGVSASFLTGDLFNLFVAFEMMLMASYVLITLGGGREQVRSGMTYVVISLLASTLLITGIALVYAATGTVNLADLAVRIETLPDSLRLALGLLLFTAFGIKAAVFPLFFWLPDSYPTAPTPVTAIFAGLLTKVGVYAIVRTQTLLFAPENGTSSLLLVVAGLTMIVGVLGAIAQDDMKRILSFHIVSQIGYMVMGLGLFTVAGVAGAVFYMVHHIPVKTALFLVTGVVEETTGTAALRRLSGMVAIVPVGAVLFFVAALSLAGIPPLSGFVGKLALVEAGIDAKSYAIVAVSLLTSLLTLFSMTKIWGGVFWGPTRVEPDGESAVRMRQSPRTLTAAAGSVVLVTLGIALAAGPVYGICEEAARSLLDPSGYVEGVLR